MSSYTLEAAAWETHSAELYSIRHAVFVIEQGVPESLEQDEFDTLSSHVLARDHSQQAIGTGRLLPDGHIGRVAVLRDWRGQGIGQAIMLHLLELARRHGLDEVQLNAQSDAVDFYQRLGFYSEGEEFMDAGIPHRSMRLRLTTK